jgi:hypothetical protein
MQKSISLKYKPSSEPLHKNYEMNLSILLRPAGLAGKHQEDPAVKSSISSALTCATCRRILESAITNQGPAKGDLIPL